MRDTVMKYVPYFPFEFDAIEAWMEKYSLEGLELTDILSGRFAKFKRTAPRKVRYRLGRPNCGEQTRREAEYLTGCKELGWEFVAILASDYYIFRTEDENAVEFDTDKTVFERKMTRRIRWEIIGALVPVALQTFYVGGTFVGYSSFGGLLARMVEDGFAIFPFGFFVIFLVFAYAVGRIVLLIKLRKRLRSGGMPEKSARLYRSGQVRAVALIGVIAVVMIWFGYALVSCYLINRPETYLMHTYDYSSPFPLLDEINTGELNDTDTDANPNSSGSGNDDVTFKRTELAPVIIKVHQSGPTVRADTESGYRQSGYCVDYYELRSEKLAEKYFGEKAADLSDGGETRTLTCAGLDEIRYHIGGGWYEQTLLIRQDNIVMKVQYTGDSDLSDCLSLYAARLAP